MTICLQLDHVNYSYGAAKIRVLSDVNACLLYTSRCV